MSNLQAGILYAIPFFVAAVGMVVFSRHSDKTLERRGHVSCAMVWAGVFLLAGVLTSHRAPSPSFMLVCLVPAGTYGALGPFWAIPTETLPASVAGSAMGLVNALGNLGGYFGPLVVGYLNQRRGNFLYAFGLLSAGFLLAAALPFLLPREAPGAGKE